MLGAQAIRTKQKSKERKKKLSGLELQCERIQKAASAFYREDEAKFLEKVAHLHLEDARAVTEIAEETKRNKQKRHHSVQEPPSTHLSSIDYSDNPHPFSKSPSTSFTKVMKSERSGMNFVNTKEDISDKRFPKWCGLLSSFSSAGNSRQSSKKPPKRRMSTFI
ncbi:Uncharacterized protein BM_BM604 [Brugia malayi]|uniref:Bm604 n=1 Tax=Brugia malayi TaxID=6279 RepID=A0A0K0JLF7_BRUMA|nr:Uncharacterized protein BM_BM604 [Brugia malayi]CRZ25300.1 Bm604 [Brugia malayi]VIO91318.1 Uncharacterized protein BM_BM604 [Brugia malayi]